MGEQKRSAGVTVVAYLIIVFSIFLLLTSLNSKNFLLIYRVGFGLVFYFLSNAIFIISVFWGVNILKLDENARRYIIILALVNIGLLFASSFVMKNTQELGEAVQREIQSLPSDKQKQIEQMYVRLENDIIQKYPPQERDTLKPYVKNWIPLSVRALTRTYAFLSFAWSSFLIFFFTRPRVVAQFADGENEVVNGMTIS